MKCKIFSLREIKTFHGVTSITLPASRGQMQVLPGHAESFIELQGGNVFLKSGKEQKQTLPVPGGICFISNNEIVITL
jgi:F0F1-type ATP synthase epsilon subunit